MMMTSLCRTMLVAWGTALAVHGASAATITPSIQGVSSELNGFSREAVHTVDSSGFTGTAHGNTATGAMWTTQGNAFAGGATDFDPFVTYDLGGLFNVSALDLWNYNETNFTQLGPQNVEVFTGATVGGMTSQGIVVFGQATASATDPGQVISVNYSGVQFIRFDILTNHDGAIFDGSGTVGGVDGRSLTGLSEVRFEATAFVAPAVVPEPSALALLGLSVLGLVVKARCRRRAMA